MFRASTRAEIFASLQLGIPIAASQMAQAGTGFIDTVMTGWLGQEVLAAGGLAAATLMTCLVTGSGMVTGVMPLVAEAYGAGNLKRVRQLTLQGLWLALLVALPVMLLLSQSQSWLIGMGQSATTAALAKSYLDIVLWGYFPAIAFVMLRGVLSSLEHPQIAMVIAVIGLGFNAIANYVLGFGKLGFPAMGLSGIAIASMLTYWGTFLALLRYAMVNPDLKRLKLMPIADRWDPKMLWELGQLGFPISVAFAAEVGLFSITTYLMGWLGTPVLAAHQIVFQTIAMIFMLPLGISYATTIRVGHWLGQGNWAGVTRAARVGVSLGAGVMTLMSLVLLLFPRSIASLYLDLSQPQNIALLPLFNTMLTIAALAQILDGAQTTMAGALRGLQDTQVPMLLSFLAFWGVGLTTGYVLGFGSGWGGVGLWLGQAVGIATAAGCFVLRWRYLIQRLQPPGVSAAAGVGRGEPIAKN